MWPSVEKVVEELRAFDEKLASLDKFINRGTGYGKLPWRERRLLFDQRRAMRHCSAIMHDRIEAHKETEAQKTELVQEDP